MNNDPSIDFTNPVSISGCVSQHLQEGPKAWISVLGFYRAQSQEGVIDFDFKTKALNPRLLRIELRSNADNLGVFSMDRSDSITSNKVTIQRYCQAVIDLVKTGLYERIILEKETEGIDNSGVQSSLRSIAKRVVYGGNIDVGFHDTTSSTIIRSYVYQGNGDDIHIKTCWSFDWLGVGEDSTSITQQGQRTWSGRLQPAMVDGEDGWIAKDDPRNTFHKSI